MVDRGPDGAGLFRQGPVVLGHRRLAIRDLNGGAQPFESLNGRYAIVFNGEIYNDSELRSQLEACGCRFRTECDTEVLVEAWSQWGPACVEKLRGMFAFGLVDLFSNELWLVRDRCGIKPLYYAEVDGDFVFASSIAAIKRHPRFSARPNFSAISHYFQTFRTTLDHQTVFEGIHTLRPAEVIRFAHGRRIHRTYWSLPVEVDHSISFDEAVWQLDQTLEQSVEMRLKSDVEVGMMLSGGVDSSTLATLVRRKTSRTLASCCGGGNEPTLSQQGGDFEFARKCANEFGFDYAESRVSDADYLESWTSLIEQYETPVATPTDAIIYRLASKLKQKVGVAIGGEGADEAYCGYDIAHWSGNDFDRANGFSQLDASVARKASESLIRQYGRDQFCSPADHYLSTCGLVPESVQQTIFQPELIPSTQSLLSSSSYYGQLFGEHNGMTMAEKYARVLFRANLESLLGRLDNATMAAGLEARVPFADHHLVEQAFRLPHHFKIDICPNEKKTWLSSHELARRGSLRSKRILRAVAARLLPQPLACRPKMSFPTPLPFWLHHKWQSWISSKLLSSSFAQEFFRPDALKGILELPAKLAMWKWPVLNTILWGERCFA